MVGEANNLGSKWTNAKFRIGVKKTYRLTYESSEVSYAVFDPNISKNHWSIPAQVLKSFGEYFGPKTEQLDIFYEADRVTFTSYTEKIVAGNGMSIPCYAGVTC